MEQRMQSSPQLKIGGPLILDAFTLTIVVVDILVMNSLVQSEEKVRVVDIHRDRQPRAGGPRQHLVNCCWGMLPVFECHDALLIATSKRNGKGLPGFQDLWRVVHAANRRLHPRVVVEAQFWTWLLSMDYCQHHQHWKGQNECRHFGLLSAFRKWKNQIETTPIQVYHASLPLLNMDLHQRSIQQRK